MGKYIHKFNTQQEFNNIVQTISATPPSSFEQYKQTFIGEVENVGISLSSNTYTIENKNYTVDETWDYNVVIDDNNSYASILFEDSMGVMFTYVNPTPIGWGATERQELFKLLKNMSDAVNFGESVSLSEVIQIAHLDSSQVSEINDLRNVCLAYTTMEQFRYFYFSTGNTSRILVITDYTNLYIVQFDDNFSLSGGKPFLDVFQAATWLICKLEINSQYSYTKPLVAKLQSDLYYNDFEYRFKLFYNPTKDRIGFYDNLNKQKYITVNSNESEGIYHENPLLVNVLFAPANENAVSNSTIFKFNGSNIPLASHFNEGVCCFGITKQNNIVYFQRISYNGEDIRIPTEAEAPTIVATYTNGEWTSQNYKKFIEIRRYETFA